MITMNIRTNRIPRQQCSNNSTNVVWTELYAMYTLYMHDRSYRQLMFVVHIQLNYLFGCLVCKIWLKQKKKKPRKIPGTYYTYNSPRCEWGEKNIFLFFKFITRKVPENFECQWGAYTVAINLNSLDGEFIYHGTRVYYRERIGIRIWIRLPPPSCYTVYYYCRVSIWEASRKDDFKELLLLFYFSIICQWIPSRYFLYIFICVYRCCLCKMPEKCD